MEKKVSAIVLLTSYDGIGETASVEILGKKMLDWVLMSLSDYSYKLTRYSDSDDLVPTLKPFVDPASEYTVVLFSDTPLITKKTVADALNLAYTTNRAVIKLTRGYVFRSDYIRSADKIYTDTPFYLDEEDFITAFSAKQICYISDILKNRILGYHMSKGVRFEDLSSTFIGCDVKIGENVVISHNNIIKGNTVIKSNVQILSGNVIDDCVIDDGAVIDSSRAVHSYIGKNASVGPYCNIRKDNVIGEKCKLGDFVEVKNCNIGDGTKMSHLTYAGDVVIGKNCNIGAGVVFANYDGKNKHKTVIGNNVFVGSSATLVAPITIGDGAFIAAGSVINKDVPSSALAIARSYQTVKEDWGKNTYYKPDDTKNNSEN